MAHVLTDEMVKKSWKVDESGRMYCILSSPRTGRAETPNPKNKPRRNHKHLSRKPASQVRWGALAVVRPIDRRPDCTFKISYVEYTVCLPS